MKRILLFIGSLLCVFSAFAQPSGYSLEFDGVDDYVEIQDTLKELGTGSFSVEMWIRVPRPDKKNKSKSSDRVGILFGNYSRHSNQVFNFELYKGGRTRIYWNHGEIRQIGKKDLRDNYWHHLVFVRDKENNEFIVYIDGKVDMKTTSAGSDIDIISMHRIGGDRRNNKGGPSFYGQLDEIRIWKTALTTEQVNNFSDEKPLEDDDPLSEQILIYYQCEPSRVKMQIDDEVGESTGRLYNW